MFRINSVQPETFEASANAFVTEPKEIRKDPLCGPNFDLQ